MFKKILELLVCIAHPVAVILVWADLLRRSDIHFPMKVIWALLALIPIAPAVYVLFSGDLW